ncbi:hypothetical protein AMTR_s00102p00083150 [Amborella trichopoda]|uniref:Uncharacterized protein n=1 Tax=Amborella trichopoda TaxID=13333 RepID=W1NT75_AMBTC|nr:hypothetical protein AMTR_s00102p00083150 [Amborella trichopoda]
MSDDTIHEMEIWEPGCSENVEIVASIDEKKRDLEMITDDKDEHLLKKMIKSMNLEYQTLNKRLRQSRKEAACLAAHCLHGWLYGDHRVAVEYVVYDLYGAGFRR